MDAAHDSCEMRQNRGSQGGDANNPIRAQPWEDLEERPTDVERTSFTHWYPNWDTWKFRRTISYWVAIMFLEGSLLFVVGGAFAASRVAVGDAAASKALVAVPYLMGGVCFTLGAYAGVVETLNVPFSGNEGMQRLVLFLSPRDLGGQWRELRRHLSWEPLIGYASYMIGATLYNVNCVFIAAPQSGNKALQYIMT